MPFFNDIDATQPPPDGPAGLGDDEIRALKQRVLDTLGGLNDKVEMAQDVLLDSPILSSFQSRILALEAAAPGNSGNAPGNVPLGLLVLSE